MRHLSLGWLTLQGSKPTELVAAASAAGYHGVSLMLGDTFMPPSIQMDGKIHSLLDDPELRRETAKVADATGITFDAMEGFLLTPFFDLEKCQKAVDVTAELGLTQIAAMDTDPDRGRAAENLAALCEMSATSGIGVCLEFMSLSEVKTIGATVDLIASGKYPGLSVLLDTLHLARSGGTAADVRKVNRHLINSVQFCDGPRVSPDTQSYWYEAAVERQIPGEGELPLRAVFEAIPDDIIIYLEVPQHAAREKGVSAIERAKRAIDGMYKIMGPRS